MNGITYRAFVRYELTHGKRNKMWFLIRFNQNEQPAGVRFTQLKRISKIDGKTTAKKNKKCHY